MSDGDRTVEVEQGAAPTRRDTRAAERATWFDHLYPRLVGVVRRVLDREGRTELAVQAAEEVVVSAFARPRRRGPTPDAATTTVLEHCLDGCLDMMVGHPGDVPVHPDLLGEDVDLGASLPLAELHDALSTMRSADRHVGLLCLAAGYEPAEAAALLQRPLPEVLRRLARVATRLADARRLGLVVDTAGGRS